LSFKEAHGVWEAVTPVGMTRAQVILSVFLVVCESEVQAAHPQIVFQPFNSKGDLLYVCC